MFNVSNDFFYIYAYYDDKYRKQNVINEIGFN